MTLAPTQSAHVSRQLFCDKRTNPMTGSYRNIPVFGILNPTKQHKLINQRPVTKYSIGDLMPTLFDKWSNVNFVW